MSRLSQPSRMNPDPWSIRNTHVILWHGTVRSSADDIRHNHVDLGHSRPDLDFGRGFYTTTDRRRAEFWAGVVHSWLSQQEQASDRPVLVQFRVPLDRLALLESLVFVRGDVRHEAYWSFVTHCRRATAGALRGHIHPTRPGPVNWYDVVCGPIVKRWPPTGREAYPDSDQFSFHTPAGIAILNQLIAAGHPDFQIINL